FQMQHLFTRALETEMARLDHTSMNRPDGYFVNFAAVHAKKFAIGRGVAGCSSYRLEPRVIRWSDAVLLPDFALKQMRLRVLHRERWITAGERQATRHGEGVVGVEGQDRDEAHRFAFGHAKPRAQARAAIQFGCRLADKLRHRPRRHFSPRE